MCHKVGTIYSLVDHAIKLSHPSFHEKNLKLCIELLLNNGYPLDLIFNKINLRLRKLFVHRAGTSSNIDSSKAIIGFRCLNKLSRFIRVHKDVDQPLSKNNVVYKIFCKNCEAIYVGQIKRQLLTRLKEHKNNSRLDQSKHSVITEHSIKYNHSFDWDNTKIMDHEPRYFKRIVSEMIHIKEQKFSLNLNNDTELLDESYFNILHELTSH